MRRLGVLGLIVLCLGLALQPIARADSQLQGLEFNINGTIQTNDLTGFNAGAYNTTTGIGTLTYVFDPGVAGTYGFTSVFFVPVSVPAYNEFGSTSGSPAAGQSWEIGDINNSTIVADEEAGALNSTNMLPGTTDNFLNTCTGATCNGSVGMAMGFSFALGAGDEAVITLDFSPSAPAGFYLSDTHPSDAANTVASAVYFSGSEVTQSASGPPPPPPPVPEPSSLLLLGVGLGGALAYVKARK